MVHEVGPWVLVVEYEDEWDEDLEVEWLVEGDDDFELDEDLEAEEEGRVAVPGAELETETGGTV